MHAHAIVPWAFMEASSHRCSLQLLPCCQASCYRAAAGAAQATHAPTDAALGCRMKATKADQSVVQGSRSRGHPGPLPRQQARGCEDRGLSRAEAWLLGMLAAGHGCAPVQFGSRH